MRYILALLALPGCASYGWAERPREGDKPLGFVRVDVETVKVPPQERMEADVITLALVSELERCGRGVRARWASPPRESSQAALSCRVEATTLGRGQMLTHDVELLCTMRHGERSETLTSREVSRTQWDGVQGPSRVGGVGLTQAGAEAARRIACPLLGTMEE